MYLVLKWFFFNIYVYLKLDFHKKLDKGISNKNDCHWRNRTTLGISFFILYYYQSTTFSKKQMGNNFFLIILPPLLPILLPVLLPPLTIPTLTPFLAIRGPVPAWKTHPVYFKLFLKLICLTFSQQVPPSCAFHAKALQPGVAWQMLQQFPWLLKISKFTHKNKINFSKLLTVGHCGTLDQVN